MELSLDKIRNFRIQMLHDVLNTNDVEKIKSFLSEFGLVISNNKIIPDEKYKSLWKIVGDNRDRRQLVRKILLNSAFLLAPIL
jgi:hypothetical protein